MHVKAGMLPHPGHSEILMAPAFKPRTVQELADYVAIGASLKLWDAAASAAWARPMPKLAQLSLMSRFHTASALYEPEELVLEAGAARRSTRLKRCWPRTASNWPSSRRTIRHCSGRDKRGTLGGMIACNLSGPRRLKAGAARDHMLGLTGVSTARAKSTRRADAWSRMSRALTWPS